MNKKVIGGVLTGVAIAASIAVTCWDYAHAAYECHECGTIYKPTVGGYLLGMNIPGKKKLTCPHCGDRNWHYKSLNI